MEPKKYTDQELSRREKLNRLIETNNNPFTISKFERNFNSETFKKKFNDFSKEELHENTTNVKIAGRIMAIRQTFGVLKDFNGKVQFYINKKNVDENI
jgi:lysyl-tRNA synthetase class 2